MRVGILLDVMHAAPAVRTWEVPCPACGGNFVLYRAPALPRPEDVVDYRHFVHRRGAPISGQEPLSCDTCFGKGWAIMSGLFSPALWRLRGG